MIRSVQEREGSFSVHCHSGKYRAPAVAATLLMASTQVSSEAAVKILERAKASKHYESLWRAVAGYTPPPQAILPELVEVAEVGLLVHAMVRIDRAFDGLKACQRLNWRVPSDQPDLLAYQQALIFKEGFRESVRNLKDHDDRFKTWLKQAKAITQ